jgi:hypothetical protein
MTSHFADPAESRPLQDVSALSPYLIPPALQGRKVRNLGDGFILRAIERRMGAPFDPARVFSPRTTPDAAAVETMRRSRLVVLAGANQLNDKYTVWPGLDAAQVAAGGFRFIPFGIGLHGEAGFNDGMSAAAKGVLEVIHDVIPFSSWRCPSTVEYLRRQLPHRANQFLMTGCPVIYDRPLLEGERFSDAEGSVAVTATERGEFWARESTLIDAVARRFPRARKFFVVHQNFSPPAWHERWRHALLRPEPTRVADKVEGLRAHARRRGFEVVFPQDVDDCIAFYSEIDVHVGTRLHAHLLFLSRNKRTFLVPVDARPSGMAEYLGFPLPKPEELDRHWDFDFEIVRRNAREAFCTMQKFTESLRHAKSH